MLHMIRFHLYDILGKAKLVEALRKDQWLSEAGVWRGYWLHRGKSKRNFGDNGTLVFLTVGMVTRLHACIKTHRIVHHFTVHN